MAGQAYFPFLPLLDPGDEIKFDEGNEACSSLPVLLVSGSWEIDEAGCNPR